MSSIRFRRTLLALALALALPLAHAQSVGSAFTYQGELRAAGSPANAAYDFQFRLFNAVSGGTQLGTQVSSNAVTVANGLFTVPLDFGPAQFAGDAQWLEISVRPAGSGAFETLAPRTAITPTPYALGAVAALANSVTTTSIVDGTIQFSDVTAAQFQARVTGTCSGSQGIQSIGANGTVVCGTFGGGGGTITGVTAGTGLTGGGTSGNVTLGIANSGVGAEQVNATQVQRRVSGTCATGQYVRQVNQDGTVVCGTDAGGAAGWGLTGNAGTNPATNFIGTSDAQPLVLRSNNSETARFGERQIGLFAPQVPLVELTLRSNDNTTEQFQNANLFLERNGGAVREGVMVSVGGGTSGSNDQGLFVDQYNAVNQQQKRRLALTGNGRGRFGGNNLTVDADNAVAAGGGDNTASGLNAAALGGANNTASGFFSASLGGTGNCAGADFSVAMGRNAKVRVGTDVGIPGSGCAGVPNSGDIEGDEGSFVWADAQEAAYVSSGPNQFLIRAGGGFGVNANTIPPGFEAVFQARDTNTDLYLRTGAHPRGISLAMVPTAGAAEFYVFQTDGAGFNSRLAILGNAAGGFGGSNNLSGAGTNSVILGGTGNTVQGANAIVAGGERNSAAGARSFAGGFRATVRPEDPGAFVWADQVIDAPFTSEAANSFSVRSTGGARFVTGINIISGAPTTGVQIGPNQGAWSSLSDRAVKTAVERIDVGQVLDRLLDMPISSWSYTGADAVRHIGPMAQDFFASFGLGDSERHISTIDADGIALAAIQGLNAKLEAENAELRNRSASLEDLTRQLLDRVSALEAGAAAPR